MLLSPPVMAGGLQLAPSSVFFLITVRIGNGNPANDHSDSLQEIGTFHGGALAGLTQKLILLQQLCVNAL